VQPALLLSAGIDPRAGAVGDYVNLAHNITTPQLTFAQAATLPKGGNIARNNISQRIAPAHNITMPQFTLIQALVHPKG
jgi:hypothetical protein